MHPTRTNLESTWDSMNPDKLLNVIRAMATSELRTLLDEFNLSGKHRGMSPSCYLMIVGEMIRRVDPREFRPYGNY